jgi:putative glutamine amidotransferase
LPLAPCDDTMLFGMSRETNPKPRVGIPYRTRKEELTGEFAKIEKYTEAVRRAGGEAVVISLGLSPAHLCMVARTLDAVLLPGSPADIEASRFGAARHPEAADPDPDRERTDFTLLEHSLAEQKPVLAICYGTQTLNVFLGGTLVQDIPSEVRAAIEHDGDDEKNRPETFHTVRIETGSQLAQTAGTIEVRVNSSHHQAILEPGRKLRVVSRAPDGVVEAVEWAGDENWVTGVQWHPERMMEADPLARKIFRQFVAAAAARKSPVRA